MTEEQKPEEMDSTATPDPETQEEVVESEPEKSLAEGVLGAVDAAMEKAVEVANTTESKFGEGLGKTAELAKDAATAAVSGVEAVTGVSIEITGEAPDSEDVEEPADSEEEAGSQSDAAGAEVSMEEELSEESGPEDQEITEDESWAFPEDQVERDFLKKLYAISDDALSELFQKLEPGKLAGTVKGLSQETRRKVRARMPEELLQTWDDTLAHIEPVGEMAKSHSQAMLNDLMSLWGLVEEVEGEDFDEDDTPEGEELSLGQLNAADTLEWLLALSAAYESEGAGVIEEAMSEADDPMLSEGLSMLAESWPLDRMKLILERRKKAELIEAERRLDIIEAALGMMREGASPSEIRKVCEAFLPYDA